MYKSDIRSMINFMQLNQESSNLGNVALSNEIMENIFLKIMKKENFQKTIDYIHEISVQYNHDKKTILKKFFNYIIHTKPKLINYEFLNICETVMHDNNIDIYINCK